MVGCPLLLRTPRQNRLRFWYLAVTLRYVNAIAWAGFVTVSIALAYAFTRGHVATDWEKLIQNPLGLATLIDVYVGFALFACWILWREARSTMAFLWIAMMLVGGNLVSTLYVLMALRASNGVVEKFWLGSRYQDSNIDKLR